MKKYFLPLILIFLLIPFESFSGVKLLEKCTTYPVIESISVGKNNRIFIGAKHYIYYSDDVGVTWNTIKQKYPGYFTFFENDIFNDSFGNLYVKDYGGFHLVPAGTNVQIPNKLNEEFVMFEYKKNRVKTIFGRLAFTSLYCISYYPENSEKFVRIDSSFINSSHLNESDTWGYHPKLGIYKGKKNILQGDTTLYYKSIDTGKTWYRFNKLPNNPTIFDSFEMIDDNFFKVVLKRENYIYDMKNGEYKVHSGSFGEIYAYGDNLYELKDNKIFYSKDRGKTFSNFLDSNVKCMAIDSIGNVLYYNYKLLFKYNPFTDQKSALDLSGIGCVQATGITRKGKTFVTNTLSGYYYFLVDSSKIKKINIPSKDAIKNFDFTEKNEILYTNYTEKDTVHYSSDGGNSWEIKDPKKNEIIQYGSGFVKFLNDGTIYADNNEFFPLKSGEIILAVNDTIKFKNSKNEILKTYVKFSKDKYYYFSSMGDGEVYLRIEEGIFYVDWKNRTLSKVANPGAGFLATDDLGNLYGMCSHPDVGVESSVVKYNKIENKWDRYYVGVGDIEYSFVTAYGDSKIIIANDFLYLQELKDEKYLLIKHIDTIDIKRKTFKIQIIDQNYQPVEGATVSVYDKYSDKIDTLFSGANGEATYTINEKLKAKAQFYFSVIASKKDFNSSGSSRIVIYNRPDTNNLKVDLLYYKDTPLKPLDRFICDYNPYYKTNTFFKTKIYFYNYLFSKLDSIEDVYKNYTYHFLIPKDTKQGIYALDIFIKNENGEKIYSNKQYFMVDDFREIKDVVENEECTSNSVINFYPNPCVNKVSLQITENDALGKMIIVSLGGKLMYEGEYKKEFDISDFPAGTYYVQIGEKFGKFVKMK